MPLQLNEAERKAEQSILIENTTKEQREEIVKKGIAFVKLDRRQDINIEDYSDYIDGKKELREVINEIIDKVVKGNE
ncbi:MAG: purine biosynthesis protein PurH [Coprobacillus sp.]|nr:purine biosynthesis protein PurH [Coprobacillus sp.]